MPINATGLDVVVRIKSVANVGEPNIRLAAY